LTESAHPQIRKLANRLFETESERAEFLKSLFDPVVLSPTIIDLSENPLPFTTEAPLPGQSEFVKRLTKEAEPTRNHLHDEGAYYCLDYSSAFAASIVQDLPKNPDVILDVCAAPGGKSIFAWKALQPKILLSNEIVIGRAKALISNLKRCHIPNTRVLNLAPEQLAERIPKVADVVLLDVPCSGQSLMVKGKALTGTFLPHVVSGNVKRQRRILANAAKCVKPGGYMAYMTCTFAPEENEKNLEWFMKKFSEFEAVEVPRLNHFKSHLSDFPSYRIWPHRLPSAGSFAALLKNKEEAMTSPQVSSLISDLRPIWQS
jgi:16S rRNA C967 or C1407 C5-methylase (RsmB/RsmF family)